MHIIHKWRYDLPGLRTCKICNKHQDGYGIDGWSSIDCEGYQNIYKVYKPSCDKKIEAKNKCEFHGDLK